MEKIDTRAPHPLRRLEAYVETQAVDCGHLRFLRLYAREGFGQEHKRIAMVIIHVANDFGGGVR